MRPSIWVRQDSAAGFFGFRMQPAGMRTSTQIVEAVVEQDLRIEQIDGEGAEEHLEHFFVQQEVDRGERLRIAAVEVEDRLARPRATACRRS